MEKNQIIILEDRGLIQAEGIDAKEFLQNIITNDIDKVDEWNSIFSAIFTPQGKYLYEFFIIKNKDGYLLDCHIEYKDDLIKHLLKYKLRSKIEVKDLSSSHVVGIISQNKFEDIQQEEKNNKKTIWYRESPCFIDTRLFSLGARILSSLENLHLTIKKLNLKIVDKSYYLKLSHEQGIPVEGIKNLQNNIFGLESNLEELNAIDFKKGCYVGQENTARMRLKNKLRKRLLPIISNNPLKISDEIKFNDQVIGKVLIDGQYPFALIKLFDPDFKIYSKQNLKVKEYNVQILSPAYFKI
ncbi:folate-binding protein [Pelagibacteraceae bacterium]|jgi:folate-binding protein YgfZ|nr:folate-binding protein [Pelagibacteraceae bacterium]